MPSLTVLLELSQTTHRHLCPRQVLGVRMGMLAGEALGLALPQGDKRLLTIVETDGCFVDGVAVATGCYVGRRTLRVEDFGKVAATFVDTDTGAAVRLVPRREARTQAWDYAPEAKNKWEAMLLGYQRLPIEQLFDTQTVRLLRPLSEIISRAGAKAICDRCGEEIINERELHHDALTLCRACAGGAYYAAAQIHTSFGAVISPPAPPVFTVPAGSINKMLHSAAA